MLKAIKKSLSLISKVATDDQIPFLFEQTTDLFISLSSDFTISNINPAVATLFSDKQKKCIGKKYHELFGADKALCALLGNQQQLISKLKKLDHQPLLQVSFIWDSHITWLINALWKKSGDRKSVV